MFRFQWVECHIDIIDSGQCLTEEEISTSLKGLPEGLNKTYKQNLLKIVRKGKAAAARAKKILIQFIDTLTTLHLPQLAEATIIEPDHTDLYGPLIDFVCNREFSLIGIYGYIYVLYNSFDIYLFIHVIGR